MATEPGVRLDKYVAEKCPQLSRTQAQKLIADGLVTVNDHVAKAALKLDVDDRVNITLPPPAPTSALAPAPLPAPAALCTCPLPLPLSLATRQPGNATTQHSTAQGWG